MAIVKAQQYKKLFLLINHTTFNVALVIYLVVVLVENIYKGVVSNFFNTNWLLGLVLITGFLDISKNENKEADTENNKIKTWHKYFGLTVVSIWVILFSYYKTWDLGWLGVVFSILSGIIFFLVSQLILSDA